MFHELLKIANNPKPQSFIREMMTKGIVMQYIKKEDRIISDKLLGTLNEYRTVFKRLSNLIKNHDPSLNFQIEQLVMSMQKIIVRV